RIPRAEFQKILTQRQTLKDLLSQAGQQQVRANMIRTTRLARIWALFMFINGFISIGILCGLSMVFRTPFIFPSLGATAFLVFFTPTTPAASPRNTLCGHAIGIACGYAALWVTGLQFAGPAIVTELGWTRILATALSLATTGALMIRFRMSRPANRGTWSLTSFIECQRSIVSFDRAFDDLGFLSEKFRKMLVYVVRCQAHRLIGTSFVLKDAKGRALALTSVQPIV